MAVLTSPLYFTTLLILLVSAYFVHKFGLSGPLIQVSPHLALCLFLAYALLRSAHMHVPTGCHDGLPRSPPPGRRQAPRGVQGRRLPSVGGEEAGPKARSGAGACRGPQGIGWRDHGEVRGGKQKTKNQNGPRVSLGRPCGLLLKTTLITIPQQDEEEMGGAKMKNIKEERKRKERDQDREKEGKREREN